MYPSSLKIDFPRTDHTHTKDTGEKRNRKGTHTTDTTADARLTAREMRRAKFSSHTTGGRLSAARFTEVGPNDDEKKIYTLNTRLEIWSLVASFSTNLNIYYYMYIQFVLNSIVAIPQ